MPSKQQSPTEIGLQLAADLRRHLEDILEDQVQVTLFGSQARGEATDEADIDVLVVLPDLEKSTLEIVLESAWEIGFEAGKVLSVVPATREEMGVLSASPFFQAIQREGIVVSAGNLRSGENHEPGH